MTSRTYKVLHGFQPSAGQPALLSKGLRALGHSASSIIVGPNKFGYSADYNIPEAGRDTMRRVLSEIVPSYDLVHVHAITPFFTNGHVAFPMGTDLLALKALGKRIVVHFRGSEVRQASTFSRLSPYNYVSDDPDGIFNKFNEEQQKNYIEMCRTIADKLVVTDVELLTYVPDAIILPRAMDMDEWKYLGISKTDRPLIVHAPSRAGSKGTPHVIAAVERLYSEGLNFDFRLIQGLRQEDARALYEQADIIVDQLRIGWYGVLATEGMALGKAVVSYIREDLHKSFEGDLPVAVANPDTILHVLRRLIRDASYRSKIAERGHIYCRDIHDNKKVAMAAAEMYDSIFSSESKFDISGYMRINKIQEEAYASDKREMELRGIRKAKKRYAVELARLTASMGQNKTAPTPSQRLLLAKRVIASYKRYGLFGLARVVYSKLLHQMKSG